MAEAVLKKKSIIYSFEIAMEIHIWCGTSEDCISQEFKVFMGSTQTRLQTHSLGLLKNMIYLK